VIDRPDDGRARRAPEDPAERRAARERQHQVLADLLGAYADGELPAESAARVEAHLVGCGRCRGDLVTQTALRDRLALEPVLPAPTALRARIAAAMAAAPLPAAVPAPVPAPEAAPAPAAPAPGAAEPLAAQWRRAWLGLAALVIAAFAVGWAFWYGARRASPPPAVPAVAGALPAARVPLVAAVLADYRRVVAGDLPGRARDLDAVRAATGLPVEPLRAPDLHLVGVWTTVVDGEAAAVLAYRRGDRLVLHYIVPESLHFRHSALRAAAAAHRPLVAVDRGQAVVAWSEAANGALLVSDDEPSRLLFMLPATAGSFGARPGS
jgi:anti-sigma factor RsiW